RWHLDSRRGGSRPMGMADIPHLTIQPWSTLADLHDEQAALRELACGSNRIRIDPSAPRAALPAAKTKNGGHSPARRHCWPAEGRTSGSGSRLSAPRDLGIPASA